MWACVIDFFSIRFGLLWGRKWRRQRQQRAAVQIRLNNNKAHFFPQVSKPYTYLLKMSKQYCICIAMPLSRTCTVVKCQIQFVYWYCVNRIRVTHTHSRWSYGIHTNIRIGQMRARESHAHEKNVLINRTRQNKTKREWAKWQSNCALFRSMRGKKE